MPIELELRDYFAASALIGLLSCEPFEDAANPMYTNIAKKMGGVSKETAITSKAYKIADEMLKSRQPKSQTKT